MPRLSRGIDADVGDRAQMRPVVAKVEGVGELLAGLETGEPDAVARQGSLGLFVPLDRPDEPRLGKLEQGKVGPIPAGEGVVDRRGQLGEGVAAGGGEDPSGPWPDTVESTAFDEVDPD